MKRKEKQGLIQRISFAQTTLSHPIKGGSNPEKDFSGRRIMGEQKGAAWASAAECNKCCLLARPLPR